jgi:hypothetical protein
MVIDPPFFVTIIGTATVSAALAILIVKAKLNKQLSINTYIPASASRVAALAGKWRGHAHQYVGPYGKPIDFDIDLTLKVSNSKITGKALVLYKLEERATGTTELLRPASHMYSHDNEDKLVKFLEGLDPADCKRILTRIPEASRYVQDHGNHLERVGDLIQYMRSTGGPGIEQLAEVVVTMFPKQSEFLFVEASNTPDINNAKISNAEGRQFHWDFDMDGGFLYDRFFRVDYKLDDPGKIIFGSIILELDTEAVVLQGQFAGYGYLSGSVISGSMKLNKVVT